jgi:hypothetical protein
MTYAAEHAQRLKWARQDEATKKVAYDEHHPDFDEHALGLSSPRDHPVWYDNVVLIPAASIKKEPTP